MPKSRLGIGHRDEAEVDLPLFPAAFRLSCWGIGVSAHEKAPDNVGPGLDDCMDAGSGRLRVGEQAFMPRGRALSELWVMASTRQPFPHSVVDPPD